jgi:hypothetical protein
MHWVVEAHETINIFARHVDDAELPGCATFGVMFRHIIFQLARAAAIGPGDEVHLGRPEEDERQLGPFRHPIGYDLDEASVCQFKFNGLAFSGRQGKSLFDFALNGLGCCISYLPISAKRQEKQQAQNTPRHLSKKLFYVLRFHFSAFWITNSGAAMLSAALYYQVHFKLFAEK